MRGDGTRLFCGVFTSTVVREAGYVKADAAARLEAHRGESPNVGAARRFHPTEGHGPARVPGHYPIRSRNSAKPLPPP